MPRPAQPADDSGTPPGSPSKWSKTQPPPGQWSPPSAPALRPPSAGLPRPRRDWGGSPGPGPGGQYPGWGSLPPRGQARCDPAATAGRRRDPRRRRVHAARPLAHRPRRHDRRRRVTQIGDDLSSATAAGPGPDRPDASPTEAAESGRRRAAVHPSRLAPSAVASPDRHALHDGRTDGGRQPLGTRPRASPSSDAWREARPRLLQLLGLTPAVARHGRRPRDRRLLPGACWSAPGRRNRADVLGGLAAVVVVVWLMDQLQPGLARPDAGAAGHRGVHAPLREAGEGRLVADLRHPAADDAAHVRRFHDHRRAVQPLAMVAGRRRAQRPRLRRPRTSAGRT